MIPENNKDHSSMFILNDELKFPDPGEADEDGLLAIGGDLSPPRLLLAYRSGIFPWFSDGGMIHWFSPPRRFVLFPSSIHISKSMAQLLRSGEFSITQDKAFAQVIQTCANRHRINKGATWIDDSFIKAYTAMHELGYAHSIEVWHDGILAGGLYGIVSGKIFCGESMFSTISNASKAALIHLCRSCSYELIDCQVYTPHLASMGAVLISRDEFHSLIKNSA
ncbi:MAG: leucyl/phenylalanyl-tRNA--protein transferase [Chitinophagales bacterium]